MSNEEIAKVSTAEAASGLTEGEESLDLEHLDQGVQRAKTATTKVTMGHILPRSAVCDETWSKIFAQLAGGRRMNQMQSLARVQETLGGAASRLFYDRGFLIHFAAYLAVNALLIVINLMTTPGKYWFYWPLLGWGLGIVGHAFGVLRHSRRSLRREQRGDRHRRVSVTSVLAHRRAATALRRFQTLGLAAGIAAAARSGSIQYGTILIIVVILMLLGRI